MALIYDRRAPTDGLLKNKCAQLYSKFYCELIVDNKSGQLFTEGFNKRNSVNPLILVQNILVGALFEFQGSRNLAVVQISLSVRPD